MRFPLHPILASAGLLVFSTVHCEAVSPPNIQESEFSSNQDWSVTDRQDWYHASAGTQLIPYDWFIALQDERVEKAFTSTGIIPDPAHVDRLPVGLSEPKAQGAPSSHTGLNCAFCHTTELTYRNERIRLDGGPSLQYNQQFLNVFVQSLGTLIAPDLPTLLKSLKEQNPPERFKMFAAKVLERRKEPITTYTLTKLAVDVAALTQTLIDRGGRDLSPAGWGPGRFDALGRGGNTVFGPLHPDNLRPANAPVSIPPLWGVWEYDWVQWGGSIQHPLARNIAQVIGVNAGLFAWTQHPPLGPLEESEKFRSSLDIDSLKTLENLARRLQPPRWPKAFPPIDPVLAAKGKDLYHGNKAKGIPNLCAHCHVPKRIQDPPAHGPSVRVTMIPQKEIGTDPLYLENFSHRTVDTGPLGKGRMSAKEASQYITDELLKHTGVTNDPDYAQRKNEWRDWPQYIARPHLAVWATAPFLHNGSVPNLYALLSPATERPSCFYLSPTMEFDPVNVGYAAAECQSPSTPRDQLAGFEFNTFLPGNNNRGHEFKNSPNCLANSKESGILGCELSPDQRWAIIEYLKTCDLDRLVMPKAEACHDLDER